MNALAGDTAATVIVLVMLGIAVSWFLYHHAQWKAWWRGNRCLLTDGCTCKECVAENGRALGRRLAKATVLPRKR